MNDSPAPIPTFGALILAGGRSSRMGTDKASLPYRGVTLLSHMRSLAAQAGAATVLIGGGPSGDLQDPVQGAGPVGSLCALAEYAAALSAPRRWVIVPVDMPLLTPALLGGLVSVPAPAAAFRDHPLPLALTVDENACAVFVEARARLAAGESVAVWQVLAWLKGQQLSPADTDIAQLINVNTLDEWSRLNDRA